MSKVNVTLMVRNYIKLVIATIYSCLFTVGPDQLATVLTPVCVRLPMIEPTAPVI